MDSLSQLVPVLPIRNAVLFPSISMPLVVGRTRSISALEASEAGEHLLLVVAQKVLTTGDPKPADLYTIGTLCRLENVISSEGGSRQVVVTGVSRYRVMEFTDQGNGHLSARGEAVADLQGADPARTNALFSKLKDSSREILDALQGAEPLLRLIDRVDDASYLCNVCAAYLNLSLTQKQELLETPDIDARMEELLQVMGKELEMLNVQREIRDKMSERINKAQREALLREQLRTIRTELGEEGGEEIADELEEKLRQAGLSPEARRQADDELRRLKGLPPSSAEYHVIRTYLEWLASMPWSRRTEGGIDLLKARQILDEDHYGLEAVKRRILQFLAVAKLKSVDSPEGSASGPILCLVGPPGVGKTSLGHSIARALGRKFIRTSLGGVRDEAEIRGHRRTYVGAMPGRIIQSLKRAGTKNPVMMLDELDKLRSDYHGDPSAAMLEVLDPEQNKTFTDHYLDVPFDLSDVFFIGTANVTDTIPPALRDRMEMIEVSSYTSREKLEIARRYLLPKLLREHGLVPEWVDLSDATIELLITHYTREAGVRDLSRKIAHLFRVAAEEIVTTRSGGAPFASTARVKLLPERVQSILGPARYFPEVLEAVVRPGVATGLAWTPHGGDLLFVEATHMPVGKGILTLTGQLGDVMKESAQLALSLARTLTSEMIGRKIDFGSQDIHVHVPAGAIPKDGPSAGITILTSIVSLLAGVSIDPAIAMTGEITLRGAVLPVGGIKEKILAAHRAQVRTIILPRRNEPDLSEVPEAVRSQLQFVLVDTVEAALAHTVLRRKPMPVASTAA